MYRIGIDVGGTFTHAVALTADSEVFAQVKVPTTHHAANGVADGILDSLKELLSSNDILPSQILRVAHSTTQATNALLEGDVSPVGILAVGSGLEGGLVKRDSVLEPIELARARFIEVYQEYVELTGSLNPPKLGGDNTILSEVEIREAIQRLIAKGARAIVAVSAFSVDNPTLENAIVAIARELGIPATATYEISRLYGLKARTRTAVINAAILPRMIQTAEMTDEAVRKIGITAPLVVMRSDGGAMSLTDMKHRPILTLLSGPAAGVAAALMSVKIADGIFVEVGGTSTDISCIQNGHPSVQTAMIGHHRIYLDTLDVRTVGVAGGSLPVLDSGQVLRVGPRSAHIAGLRYLSFTDDNDLNSVMPDWLSSESGGAVPVFKTLAHQTTYALTPTCAANSLGLVPENDYAYSRNSHLVSLFSRLATFAQFASGVKLAEAILQKGSEPLLTVIRTLCQEKKILADECRLVGGGGGASVWVPYLAGVLNSKVSIAEHAPVISAIGAAMALLQETVERTLVNPSPNDMKELRELAQAAVLRAGAAPESVEVRLEVDTERGILRATATGSQLESSTPMSSEKLAERAGEIISGVELVVVGQTTGFTVYQGERQNSKLLGLLKEKTKPWVVLDERGRVRVSARDGLVSPTSAEKLGEELKLVCEQQSNYGDAGKVLPALFLATDSRLIDLSGLTDETQIMTMAGLETDSLKSEQKVMILVKKKG